MKAAVCGQAGLSGKGAGDGSDLEGLAVTKLLSTLCVCDQAKWWATVVVPP